MRTSPDRSQPERASLGSLPGFLRSPALKMRKSANISKPEGASLESCCSASSAHGTVCTEAQRLRLHACLANSKFKHTPGMEGPCRALFTALLRKCERVQIVRGQKGLAWKAVAQRPLPMALLAQRHRDWGCLPVLPPQTSIVARGRDSLTSSCISPPLKMRKSRDISQPEAASMESYCSASSAHGTARTETQRLRLLACLATSNFIRNEGMGLRAGLLSKPCSENAKVSR